MMEAEMVSETLGFWPQLTRLVAQEDFIKKSEILLFLLSYSVPTLEAGLCYVTIYLTVRNCSGVPGIVLARCWGVHRPSFPHCVHWVRPA
jgi:hypothetical protein